MVFKKQFKHYEKKYGNFFGWKSIMILFYLWYDLNMDDRAIELGLNEPTGYVYAVIG